MKYILIRDVLMSESKWLKRDFQKGEILYLYQDATYNCITKHGLPFTIAKDTVPFFEIPKNAVLQMEDNIDEFQIE